MHRVGVAAGELAGHAPGLRGDAEPRPRARADAGAGPREMGEIDGRARTRTTSTSACPASVITTTVDVGDFVGPEARRDAGAREPDPGGLLLPAAARRRVPRGRSATSGSSAGATRARPHETWLFDSEARTRSRPHSLGGTCARHASSPRHSSRSSPRSRPSAPVAADRRRGRQEAGRGVREARARTRSASRR